MRRKLGLQEDTIKEKTVRSLCTLLHSKLAHKTRSPSYEKQKSRSRMRTTRRKSPSRSTRISRSSTLRYQTTLMLCKSESADSALSKPLRDAQLTAAGNAQSIAVEMRSGRTHSSRTEPCPIQLRSTTSQSTEISHIPLSPRCQRRMREMLWMSSRD